MVTVKQACDAMEGMAPLNLAESWDNVGLLVGRENARVNKILVALDVTPNVIAEAISWEADLLVTHHPVPFKPVSKINDQSLVGRQILDLAENKIALYSAHTNLDSTQGGTADLMATKLGITDTEVLVPLGYESLLKLAVYVPKSHEKQVRKAIGDVGAGHIGDYSHCSFTVEGTGRFLPGENTNPHIGSIGHLESVEEVRIETIIKQSNQGKVLAAMLEAHPYEEAAYDLYPLEIKGEAYGAGRIGKLPEPLALVDLAKKVKEDMSLDYIQYVGEEKKMVSKIAFCTGSAMDFLPQAIKSKADVFITGDMRYHDVLDGIHEGLNLINASHFGTEFLICEVVASYLKEALPDIDINVTKAQREPFNQI